MVIIASCTRFRFRYTQKMLLAAIDEHHKGTYDFFYLPIDFKVSVRNLSVFFKFCLPAVSGVVAFVVSCFSFSVRIGAKMCWSWCQLRVKNPLLLPVRICSRNGRSSFVRAT